MKFLKKLTRVALIVAVAVTLATPSLAESTSHHRNGVSSQGIYPLIDVVAMRPLVFLTIPPVMAIWSVGVLPLVAITQPSRIGESFNEFLGWPIKFCFRDLPGDH
jgi:hypothetical protein